MAYFIGVVLALGVARFAMRVGLDRDRVFYSAVMIVVASYYVLFAAMGGSGHTLILELIVMAGFVIAAVLGSRRANGSSWPRWPVTASSMPCGVTSS